MWTLYLLAKNPRCQQKLYNEVRQVLGDGSEPITPEKMDQLKYTKACMKEALRYGLPRALSYLFLYIISSKLTEGLQNRSCVGPATNRGHNTSMPSEVGRPN